MVIEFLGIPGSGKTYYANELKKSLKSKGSVLGDFSRCHSSPFIIKLINIVLDKLQLIIPKYRKIRKKIRKLCRDKKNTTPKYLPFSQAYCINRILAALFLRELFDKTEIQIINDEGLLQWVCFLCVQYDISLDAILDILPPFNRNTLIYYVDTSINQAIENIKMRNRHDCEMDFMDERMLKNYIEEFFAICKSIEGKGLICKIYVQ